MGLLHAKIKVFRWTCWGKMKLWVKILIVLIVMTPFSLDIFGLWQNPFYLFKVRFNIIRPYISFESKITNNTRMWFSNNVHNFLANPFYAFYKYHFTSLPAEKPLLVRNVFLSFEVLFLSFILLKMPLKTYLHIINLAILQFVYWDSLSPTVISAIPDEGVTITPYSLTWIEEKIFHFKSGHIWISLFEPLLVFLLIFGAYKLLERIFQKNVKTAKTDT